MTPGTVLRPTDLGRFVVLLESAGYARRWPEGLGRLSKKEYVVEDHGVTLEGAQGSCTFYFDEAGALVSHEVLEWA